MCRVTQCIPSDSSCVELPDDMDISPIFNIADLYKYHESEDEVVVPDDNPKKQIEEVEQKIRELVRAQEEKITMNIW